MIVRRTPRTHRRLRAIGLLAAAVAAGSALPGASAASSPERASYRTESLPASLATAAGARAGSDASARSTTIDFKTNRRFSLAALRWPDGKRALSGRMRAQRIDGSWTKWADLEGGQAGADGVVEEAGAPGVADAAKRGRTIGAAGSTEPLWTGPARRLQVRLTSPRPAGLSAAFVDVTGSSPRASAARASAAKSDTAGIHPRADWDPNNQCAPRSTPGIGSVQGVAVHHTAGSNEYSVDQVPAVMLAICKFHRNSNGWNDIGYNVLVDKYGGAWEGRAGGLTLAVVGAHAQGFNAVSAGISMIGDFTAIAPSPATIAAVARVAAWKLAVAGAPRTGTVALTSAGGSLSQFKAGDVATLPRVFGHRDVGQTACPGNVGYTILDGVRSSVAAADPTLPVNLPTVPVVPVVPVPKPVKITISTKKRVEVGASAVVSGTATQGSAPLRSAALALQVGSGSSWQTVSTTRTNTAGKYRFARKFTRSWGMRVARTDGDGGTSARVEMVIVPRLTLTVPTRMRVNRKITLRGTIKPGRGPVTISIERKTKSGSYISVVKAGKTKLKGRTVTVSITPHTATLYRFRLSYAGSDLAAAAKSPLDYGRVVERVGGGESI